MTSFHYTLEMIDGDGRSLGRVPVEPDWEPALECVAFAAMRRGRLPVTAGVRDGTVEPSWDARHGAPIVGGFQVRIAGAEPSELSIAYLAPQARAASAAFVSAGALRAGEPFAYRVRAEPAAPAALAEAGFLLEEVPVALPVGDGAFADLLAGATRWGAAPAADELPVFVVRAVLDEAAAQARAHPDVEVGGVLLGRLLRDRTTGELALLVTAQIPARHTVAGATSLTFTADTWAAVDADVAARGGDLIRCGWHHWHPNWCRHCPLDAQRRCTRSRAFLSAEDLHLTRVCFPQAHAVALLTSESVHTGLTWSLYGWRDGAIAARGFHIID